MAWKNLFYWGLILGIAACASAPPARPLTTQISEQNTRTAPLEKHYASPATSALHAAWSMVAEPHFYSHRKISGTCHWILSKDSCLTGPCYGMRAQILDESNTVVADTLIEAGAFEVSVANHGRYRLRLKLPSRTLESPAWNNLAPGDFVTVKIENQRGKPKPSSTPKKNPQPLPFLSKLQTFLSSR